MTQSFIVLGLGFGDEGKGRVVDYLASQYDDTLVIRFNGGHQAGHTVWHGGHPHIFASFGSGTFRDASTYISRYCTVYPRYFMNEYLALDKRGFHNPKIYIDPDAMITTIYDVVANKLYDIDNQQGTVGVGFGKTIERNEGHLCLRWRDVKYRSLFIEKVLNIHESYGSPGVKRHIQAEEIWKDACTVAEHVIEARFSDIMLNYGTHIYEGAQGIMLDQNFGLFPNVTRSNTTCQNTLDMLRSLGEINMFYVTRTYCTRHGVGWMPSETLEHSLDSTYLRDETNKDSGRQGEFRRGLLSLDLLKYAVECNRSILPIHREKENLFVTCCDQSGIYLQEEGSILSTDLAVKLGMGGKVYESHGISPGHRNIFLIAQLGDIAQLDRAT